MFAGVGTFGGWISVEAAEAHVCPIATTFRNLTIELRTAPGVGTSYIFVLRVNGVDKALTVTISGAATTGSDLVNSVTVAPGDLITWKRTRTGIPADGDTLLTVESDSTNVGESWYGFGRASSSLSSTLTRFNGVFAYNLNPQATSFIWSNVVAAAGTLTRHDVILNVSPGAGNSYTFTIYKNGVIQDGSAGSVNTQITIANAATTGTASFSLAVVPGDTVYLEIIPISAPTAAAYIYAAAFAATIDGQSQVCGTSNGAIVASSAFYQPDGLAGNSGTESNRDVLAGTRAFSLSQGYVVLDGAPGAGGSGKSYNFSVRQNAASPAGTPSVTVSETATTGSDLTGRVTMLAGDKWDVRGTTVNSPTSRSALWAFVQSPAINPDVGIEGSFPFIGRTMKGSFSNRR